MGTLRFTLAFTSFRSCSSAAVVRLNHAILHGDRKDLLDQYTAALGQGAPGLAIQLDHRAGPWSRVVVLADLLNAGDGPEALLEPRVGDDNIFALALCDTPGKAGAAEGQYVRLFHYAPNATAPLGSLPIQWHDPRPLASPADKTVSRTDHVISACLGDEDYFLAATLWRRRRRNCGNSP